MTLAIVAAAPALYIVRYWRHAPSRRDITLPPQDLNWRSESRFALSGLALIALAAVSIFIFTPTAAGLAKAPQFFPAMLGLLGLGVVAYVVRGYVKGSTTTLSRGSGFGPFDRVAQPKRYWASMAWNVLWACAMLWAAVMASRDALTDSLRDQCESSDNRASIDARLRACKKLLDSGIESPFGRAALLNASGTEHYRRKEWDAAYSDYSQSIRIYPQDTVYARYNRAYISLYRYKLRPALEDITAVIAAVPDEPAPYAIRAWIYDHLDDEARAAEDRKKFKTLTAQHPEIMRTTDAVR